MSTVRCLVGIDDTDSSSGLCTTYLAYRIAVDLAPLVRVQPYPRLVRLNPNVPFKTRGNAAVSLLLDTEDPSAAFSVICEHVAKYSDVRGGANSGVAFLDDVRLASSLKPLYFEALSGMVNPAKARRLLSGLGARTMELGNGMGVVGAASALGFDGTPDRTYELIAYREKENWGTPRTTDSSSVKAMDLATFPRTYNNYDYQKRKVLVSPHGPDPVLAGVRGESPGAVVEAYSMLSFGETPQGHMVYMTNQHTDAHVAGPVEWKAYSSGWLDCVVQDAEVGEGGHVYVRASADGTTRTLAAYEPTGDLRRAARLLQRGDRVRAYGGVRRASTLHPEVLNMEKFELLSHGLRTSKLPRGVYVSSPRANRHLTKPLVRYLRRTTPSSSVVEGWLSPSPRPQRVPAESR